MAGGNKSYKFWQYSVTTAAKILGHSDPMVTLKIYTMVRDNEIDDIGVRLEIVL